MWRAILITALASTVPWEAGTADAQSSFYRVNVNLVALSFSVADSRGHPVRHLQPADIRIFEDGIPQKIAAFSEGSFPLVHVSPGASLASRTSIYILFDTSDPMYRNIPYVCDSIAEFLRRLDPSDSVALYTFSKNLFRAAPLTDDHRVVRAALAQNVSVGADTALLNCLLLTARDAAKQPGRKAIVVFSNGPDHLSMVSPEDVGRVAEDEGIPVYVISTVDPSRNRPLVEALDHLTARTGGKLYLARNWQVQARAFASIHGEIASSYTAYYYPAPNSNSGYRSIKVEVAAPHGSSYHVRSRAGYQPRKAGSPPTN